MVKRALLLGSLCVALFMTTARADEAKWITRVYPVADIVTPVVEGEPALLTAAGNNNGDRQPSAASQLASWLMAAIAPASWTNNGGLGYIHYHPGEKCFEIVQTADGHGNIADLLSALRRLLDLQMAVTAQQITMSRETWEQLQRTNVVPAKVEGVYVINDMQFFGMMELIQGDRRAICEGGAALRVFNGQTVGVASTNRISLVPSAITDRQNWWITPVIAADRSAVRLVLSSGESRRSSKSLLNNVEIQVPSGGSALAGVTFTENKETVSFILIRPQIMVWDQTQRKWTPASNEADSVSKGTDGERLVDRGSATHTAREGVLDSTDEPLQATSTAAGMRTGSRDNETTTRESKPDAEHSATTSTVLRDLLRLYDNACNQNENAEAERLARAALALDPLCFRR